MKERELPDAYPSNWHRQAPQQWISTEKSTPQLEREPTTTCSHCFEIGGFVGREQEQFAQVYDKVSNGLRISLPFGELNHHLCIINASIASALGSGSPSC